MAMANTNGGNTTKKKLTPEQAKLAGMVQRIGNIDKKPARAAASGMSKMSDTKKSTTSDIAKKLKPFNLDQKANAKANVSPKPTKKPTLIESGNKSGKLVGPKDLKAAKKKGK